MRKLELALQTEPSSTISKDQNLPEINYQKENIWYEYEYSPQQNKIYFRTQE